MTTSDHKKVFKQLKNKPIKLKKFLKHNAPKERKTGKAVRHCRRCGRVGAHIQKYGIGLFFNCLNTFLWSLVVILSAFLHNYVKSFFYEIYCLLF